MLTPADSYVFIAGYATVDWIGGTDSVTLDPISGVPSSTVDWSAQAKLDSKSYSTRSIWTYDASVVTTKLRAFTSANYAANSYFNKPRISTSPTGLTQFLCSSADICLSATNQDTSHGAGQNLSELPAWRPDERRGRDGQHQLPPAAFSTCWAISSIPRFPYVTSPQYNYVDPG